MLERSKPNSKQLLLDLLKPASQRVINKMDYSKRDNNAEEDL